jgi:hypothetical protein
MLVIKERMRVKNDLVNHQNKCVSHEEKHLRQREGITSLFWLLFSYIRVPASNLLRQDVHKSDGNEDTSCEGVCYTQYLGRLTASLRPSRDQAADDGLCKGYDAKYDQGPGELGLVSVTRVVAS